jgi:hypothetical protein
MDARLDHASIRALGILAAHWNQRDGVARVKIATLAVEMGVQRRWFKRAMAELVKLGYVERREKRNTQGREVTSEWVLVLTPTSGRAQVAPPKRAQVAPPKRAQVAPPGSETRTESPNTESAVRDLGPIVDGSSKKDRERTSEPDEKIGEALPMHPGCGQRHEVGACPLLATVLSPDPGSIEREAVPVGGGA